MGREVGAAAGFVAGAGRRRTHSARSGPAGCTPWTAHGEISSQPWLEDTKQARAQPGRGVAARVAAAGSLRAEAGSWPGRLQVERGVRFGPREGSHVPHILWEGAHEGPRGRRRGQRGTNGTRPPPAGVRRVCVVQRYCAAASVYVATSFSRHRMLQSAGRRGRRSPTPRKAG